MRLRLFSDLQENYKMYMTMIYFVLLSMEETKQEFNFCATSAIVRMFVINHS